MVAIQRVEYDSKGQICPPRKELLKLRRELNGEITGSSSHWHRHTIATENQRAFDSALARLKGELNRIGAEVVEVDRSGPTVVDIFYLVENKNRTAEVARAVARGNCPAEASLNELSPAR